MVLDIMTVLAFAFLVLYKKHHFWLRSPKISSARV